MNIQLWRENLQDLQGSLKLCDEIDFMLKQRALEEKYIYSEYVSIKYLDIRDGINIEFGAKKMEFYVLNKMQEIAEKHNLIIDENIAVFEGSYKIKIKFRKINNEEAVK